MTPLDITCPSCGVEPGENCLPLNASRAYNSTLPPGFVHMLREAHADRKPVNE